MAVTSATPQSWGKYNYKFRSSSKAAPASKAPSPRAEKAYSDDEPAANSYSTPSSSSYSSDNGFQWNWGSIMEYVSDPWLGLEKAQYLMEELNKDLPDALAKMDPGIKNDIKEVNKLVLEICDKASANAKDNGINSIYSPSSIRKTCAFLDKHVPEISRGLDEPEVITNLITKVGKFGSLAKQMSDLFD